MTKADLGLAVMVLGVVVIYTAYAFAFPLRNEHRKTQRYPLFASRHHIVMLVAKQKLTEEDEVFQFLYQSVNYLIPQAKQLSHLGVLRATLASPITRLLDEGFRENLLSRLSDDDPEVRQVTREFMRMLAGKLSKILTVWVAIRMTSLGLSACLRFFDSVEKFFAPIFTGAPSGREAFCIYRAVETTYRDLAA
jgi:hypothetical protein